MTTPQAEAAALALLSPDSIFFIDSDLAIRPANAAAQALMAQQALIPDERLLKLLHLSSGVSTPVIGGLTFGEGQRRKCLVQMLRREPRLYAVRVEDPRDDRFKALSDRIRDLDQEVARRRQIQARLEEALEQKNVLYSELQHRVKNNLQLMLSLFFAAQRDAKTETERQFIEKLRAKLEAIVRAQKLMYAAKDAAFVPARDLLEAVCRAYNSTEGAPPTCVADAQDARIPNDKAFPLALILNELVANAIKHGGGGSEEQIKVTLREADHVHVLCVEDQGPGFAINGASHTASGLGLIRSLCRQIGGRLDVATGAAGRGARVSVIFDAS